MRAINADEVIKDLLSYKAPIEYSEMQVVHNGVIDDCICVINATPTLDVKPIVHAHWIDPKYGVYKCSNCRHFLDFSGVNAGRGDANYCPNCGAKMEIGNDE